MNILASGKEWIVVVVLTVALALLVGLPTTEGAIAMISFLLGVFTIVFTIVFLASLYNRQRDSSGDIL